MKNNDAKHVFLMLKDFPRLRDWLFKKSPKEMKVEKIIEDEIKRLQSEFHR